MYLNWTMYKPNIYTIWYIECNSFDVFCDLPLNKRLSKQW